MTHPEERCCNISFPSKFTILGILALHSQHPVSQSGRLKKTQSRCKISENMLQHSILKAWHNLTSITSRISEGKTHIFSEKLTRKDS